MWCDEDANLRSGLHLADQIVHGHTRETLEDFVACGGVLQQKDLSHTMVSEIVEVLILWLTFDFSCVLLPPPSTMYASSVHCNNNSNTGLIPHVYDNCSASSRHMCLGKANRAAAEANQWNSAVQTRASECDGIKHIACVM